MSPDNSPIDLTPSIVAYLTDRAIRTAVDSLLQFKISNMPPGLAVHELGEYLPARAAAELTRYEYAQALHRAWWEVWGSKVDSLWVSPDLDALQSAEQVVTVEGVWKDKWFSLYQERGSTFLYTFVEFNPEAVSIGYSLEDDVAPLLKEAIGPFVWHEDGNYEGWFVATWPMSIARPDFDWVGVQAAASAALMQVEAYFPR
ncbi:hypothetical protein [Sphingomonas sp. Root241]|uniref:hypothetical protein n=1 Tax=Sphingomonas sp. Root241 TaxID=1736501 RepID=UPI0006FEBFBD|nr:hypothetical protein [Sphingomonas sp. Root241]KRC81306.1 hypothetical protein ASE13_02585 [Sphingomonas sp. Root241]